MKSPYGKRGGTSATAGRKAVRYNVVLPDYSTATKHSFFPPANPVAYVYQADGAWHVAAIGDADDQRFARYTKCRATPFYSEDMGQNNDDA